MGPLYLVFRTYSVGFLLELLNYIYFKGPSPPLIIVTHLARFFVFFVETLKCPHPPCFSITKVQCGKFHLDYLFTFPCYAENKHRRPS